MIQEVKKQRADAKHWTPEVQDWGPMSLKISLEDITKVYFCIETLYK